MPKIRTGNFTEPQISPKNPSPKSMYLPWFVWFRFLDANEPDTKKAWKLQSYKENLNEITDYRQRLKSAKALCEQLKEHLKGGFNPIAGKFERPEMVDSNPLDK